MTITRALLIADSNGRPAWLPGDITSNPNNPVFEPFYTTPIVGAFESLHVSPESTGWMFCEFWLGNARVAGPTLLSPGIVVNIKADKVVPVGVRRSGEIWCMLSDTRDVFAYTRSDNRAAHRGMQANVFPLTQISLYPGGPLSNLRCHPNSAPGSATPMVVGTATALDSMFYLGGVGYTAANWAAVYLAAFNVDPATQNVVNIRRLTSTGIPGSGASMTASAADLNTWDRLGVIAIPSAANPDPSLAPATVFQFVVDGFSTYSRKAEFGYLGIGAGAELV